MPPEIVQVYTWTPDEVTRFLANALQCLEDAEIPEHLQPVAFEKAFQALSHHHAVPKESALALPIGRFDG